MLVEDTREKDVQSHLIHYWPINFSSHALSKMLNLHDLKFHVKSLFVCFNGDSRIFF